MSKVRKNIEGNKEIQEKRDFLKVLSQQLKPLIEQGVISSINEGLTDIYLQEGHEDLRTLKDWNKEGKRVKKGEKALLLWGKPRKIKDRADAQASERATAQDGEKERQFFPLSYVFSSQQVEEVREDLKTYKSNISSIRLVREKSAYKKAKITTSNDVATYAREMFGENITLFEETYAIFLNRANNTEAFAKISQGGISGTVVDIRLIIKYAIDTLASGVILLHNHPSGNMSASPQDMAITRKLNEALKWFDITLLDHVIMSENDYYSLADNGLMR